MKNLLLILLALFVLSCEKDTYYDKKTDHSSVVEKLNGNIIGYVSSCVYPVNESIVIEGVEYPYYVESESFEFNNSMYKLLSVPTYFEAFENGDLYWTLYHKFVDTDADEPTSITSSDEAFWTYQSPGIYKVLIEGNIIGGEGFFDGVKGKMKMKGDGEFTPDCPSFFFDAKIHAKLRKK